MFLRQVKHQLEGVSSLVSSSIYIFVFCLPMCLCDISVGVFLLMFVCLQAPYLLMCWCLPCSVSPFNFLCVASVFPPPTSVPSLNILLLCFNTPTISPCCVPPILYVCGSDSLYHNFPNKSYNWVLPTQRGHKPLQMTKWPFVFPSPWEVHWWAFQRPRLRREGGVDAVHETESETPLSRP